MKAPKLETSLTLRKIQECNAARFGKVGTVSELEPEALVLSMQVSLGNLADAAITYHPAFSFAERSKSREAMAQALASLIIEADLLANRLSINLDSVLFANLAQPIPPHILPRR